MVYTNSNITVQSWLNLIRAGKRRIEDVPALFNLREAVESALKEEEAE
jgi:hypothetical protein